jgi:hypothetical protein
MSACGGLDESNRRVWIGEGELVFKTGVKEGNIEFEETVILDENFGTHIEVCRKPDITAEDAIPILIRKCRRQFCTWWIGGKCKHAGTGEVECVPATGLIDTLKCLAGDGDIKCNITEATLTNRKCLLTGAKEPPGEGTGDALGGQADVHNFEVAVADDDPSSRLDFSIDVDGTSISGSTTTHGGIIGMNFFAENGEQKVEIVRFEVRGKNFEAKKGSSSEEISNLRLVMNDNIVGVFNPNAATPRWEFAAGEMDLLAMFDDESDFNALHVVGQGDCFLELDVLSGDFSLKAQTPSGDLAIRGTLANSQPFPEIATPDTVECNEPGGATVLLDSTGTVDLEGDVLAFTWFVNGELAGGHPMEETFLPLGASAISLNVKDGHGAAGLEEKEITVADTTPPVVEALPESISVCLPIETTVEIPEIVVTDECSTPDQISATVEVTKVKGTPVDPSAFPIVDDMVTLPLGTHELTWTVVDAQGLVTIATQSLTLVHEVTADCCDAEQLLIEGTDGDDAIVRNDDAAYCVLGFGGDDLLRTKGGNDFLDGGPGDDTLHCGADVDVVLGGEGDDTLLLGPGLGTNLAFAGPGNDVVNGSQDADTVYLGPGDDIANTHGGDDVVYPGPGRDVVHTQGGNDTVIVYDVCELEPGEILNGGPGEDTLVIPIPLEEVEAMGVFVLSFETVIVDDSKTLLSECT